jgi:hypothetical protein
MKKLLILFAILDISVVMIAHRQIFSLLTHPPTGDFVFNHLTFVIMYLSLACSAYFLLRQHKIGLLLTYGQFPIRYLTSVFSFSFLVSANSLIRDFYFPTSNYIREDYLFMGLIVLEFIRLILTIIIHAKGFKQHINALAQ